jgi:hypothetical protein
MGGGDRPGRPSDRRVGTRDTGMRFCVFLTVLANRKTYEVDIWWVRRGPRPEQSTCTPIESAQYSVESM